MIFCYKMLENYKFLKKSRYVQRIGRTDGGSNICSFYYTYIIFNTHLSGFSVSQILVYDLTSIVNFRFIWQVRAWNISTVDSVLRTSYTEECILHTEPPKNHPYWWMRLQLGILKVMLFISNCYQIIKTYFFKEKILLKGM